MDPDGTYGANKLDLCARGPRARLSGGSWAGPRSLRPRRVGCTTHGQSPGAGSLSDRTRERHIRRAPYGRWGLGQKATPWAAVLGPLAL